ncbi:hypothetical protein EG328_006757 [Venturia inaequalis]|uniref:Uncharacterized protein n=1 Tax=Venturia inaequalis TaxID=5025 RepID=A0A8H3ZHD5_VENIN|nr:hypothetical protein EG328_006757 [Venturia inaequalis]KAE9992066.1 hypothetical protein EG327_010278 [Venturia inaequalis]
MSDFFYSGMSTFSGERNEYAYDEQATTGEMDGQYYGAEQQSFEPEDEENQFNIDDIWTQHEAQDHHQDAIELDEEHEQDHGQDLEPLASNDEDNEDEDDEDEDDNNAVPVNNFAPVNNMFPINNAVLYNVPYDYAAYVYSAANDPCLKKLKLPSQEGSSSCTTTAPTTESLLYIDPGKIEVTRVALPPSILNAALTNMKIAEWSRMLHPLQSIFTRIQNPTPTKDQIRAPGHGPRAGVVRILGQQVPNRLSGRNARYLERNGLLAVPLGKRFRRMIPIGTMSGMISFSDAQWFFNVRGVLQRGTFTMTAPVDYYQGIPADLTRIFNLPCPQDVTPLIRQELAKHGRILPTFMNFLRRHPAIVHHYNIDMTTGMPFVNGRVVISPAITALPIVAVVTPAIAPVAIAPVAMASCAVVPPAVGPPAIDPPTIAPPARAPVNVTAPLQAAQPNFDIMVPMSQHLTPGSTRGRPQKRGREDEEYNSSEDNKKLRMGAAPYDSFTHSTGIANQDPSDDNNLQFGQNYGVGAYQAGYDNYQFGALPDPSWVAAGHTQQLTNGVEFPYRGAESRSFDTNSDEVQYHGIEASSISSNISSSDRAFTPSQYTPLTEPEATEPPIVFDAFNHAWTSTSDYLADALNGFNNPYDSSGFNGNMMDNGFTENLEYSPDIPLPCHYLAWMYPPLDEEITSQYQGNPGSSGEELRLEDEVTGSFTFDGEVEDDELSDLF